VGPCLPFCCPALCQSLVCMLKSPAYYTHTHTTNAESLYSEIRRQWNWQIKVHYKQKVSCPGSNQLTRVHLEWKMAEKLLRVYNQSGHNKRRNKNIVDYRILTKMFLTVQLFLRNQLTTHHTRSRCKYNSIASPLWQQMN